ncbi:uncharacterized protein LOC131597548 [Vicia villosa]|uniref:uncharacterized protein LOC131597548 n=1 Tax=Vicia villosa TaxID=3911 RepID=UPI00273CD604|nr:uncharacterized protein LOC131597548 [Vicia villosa]
MEQLGEMLPQPDPVNTSKDEFYWAEDEYRSFSVKNCVVLEDAFHLFDGCPTTRRIWSKVGEWIGSSVNLSNKELRNYLDHFTKIKAVDERLTVGIIWSAVLWNFWLMRNDILFKGNVFTFDECFSAIVLTSWKWFRSVNDSSTACNFHF